MPSARFWLDQSVATARLTRDLPRFVRRPVSLGQAERAVRDRLANRASTFARTVEHSVFRNRRSPYLPLLRHAGVELGDFRALVGTEGVEGALVVLARHGVRLSPDEMKGRRPITRGSLSYSPPFDDFANPLVKPHFLAPTSGSTGQPQLAGRSLDEFTEVGEQFRLLMRAHDENGGALVQWLVAAHSVYPYVRGGLSFAAWWYTVASPPSLVRVLHSWIRLVGQVGGFDVPIPVPMPLDRADAAARGLVKLLERHRPLWIHGTVSAAAASSAAATRLGLSLEGVYWLTMGEPVTRARAAVIERAGGVLTPDYSSTETGIIGFPCRDGATADDVHVLQDRFGMIDARMVDPTAPNPRSLFVSNISPTVGTVCLNLEIGDEADVVTRDCRCPFGQVGLRAHLVNIGSFDKLTGQGITMLGAELSNLMEHVLPARVGGAAGDYQPVERQAADGSARVEIRVHPRVGEVDHGSLRGVVFDSIASGALVGPHVAEILKATDAVDITRAKPSTTASGKAPLFVPLRAYLALVEQGRGR